MRVTNPAILAFVSVLTIASLAVAEEADPVAVAGGMNETVRIVGLAVAASMAVSLSVLGSAYAVARIGAAALGAAAEKPELLPRSLLLVALAEGLAVLGFALAMVLIQKI